jgi:hypothetical protein
MIVHMHNLYSKDLNPITFAREIMLIKPQTGWQSIIMESPPDTIDDDGTRKPDLLIVERTRTWDIHVGKTLIRINEKGEISYFNTVKVNHQ